MMHPQVGDKVQQNDIPGPDLSRRIVQDGAHDQQAQIRQGHAQRLRPAEDLAEGVEVAGHAGAAATLGQTLGTGGNVQEQIQLPAHQLVADQLDEGHDGGLLGQMLELLDADVLLLGQLFVGPGDEDGVLLHVPGVAVVAGVGDLPGEVGDHEERVGGPADKVVEGLVLGEGTVAALMGENP